MEESPIKADASWTEKIRPAFLLALDELKRKQSRPGARQQRAWQQLRIQQAVPLAENLDQARAIFSERKEKRDQKKQVAEAVVVVVE